MEIATPPTRPAPVAGSGLPAPGAEHRAALLRYAARLLEDVSLATEIVDATYAAMPRQGEGGSGAEAAERTGEKLFAECRRRAMTRVGLGGRAVRDGSAEAGDPRASLSVLVERLTPKQREVVWLRFTNGFRNDTVARITGHLVHNVNFLLHSALTSLAETRAGATVPGLEDARVSAHVLDELRVGERDGFAAGLKQDATARAAVATVRALARELSEALDDGSNQRRRAGVGRRWGGEGGLPWKWIFGLGAGVAVLGAVGAWWWQRPARFAAAVTVPSGEDFRLKPDVWKLARARAEADAELVRAGARATGTSAPSVASAAGLRPVAVENAVPEKARAEEREPVVGVPRSPGGVAGAAASRGAADASVANNAGPKVGEGSDGRDFSGLGAFKEAGAEAQPVDAKGKGAGPSAAAPTTGGGKVRTLPARPNRGGAKPESEAAQGARAESAKPAATAAKAAAEGAAKHASRAEEGEVTLTEEREKPQKGTVAAARPTKVSEKVPAVPVSELLKQFSPREAVATATPGLAITAEVAAAPWDASRRLVRVVVGAVAAPVVRGADHLVLLVDTSASMEAPERLPLVQAAARRLLERLRPEDRVSIVTYADEARVVLAATPVARAGEIAAALAGLRAEGQTNGGAGLWRAYDVARAGRVAGGVTRVVWCTDGDFNVGVTSEAVLAARVSAEAKEGVSLSVIGFGRGRQIDARLESLAALGRGRGTYANTRREAEERLGSEASGPRATVARDVRVALECDPASVAAVRLVGAEDLFLPPEAAARRRWDAGDVRAGETHVALFELVPTVGAGAEVGEAERAGARVRAREITLRVEHEGEGVALAQRVRVRDAGATFAEASGEFKFSATVAALGLAWRETPVAGAKLAEVVGWAEAAAAERAVSDPAGYRGEFLALAREARAAAAGK